MRSLTLVPGHATQQGLATNELSSSALHRLSLRFLHPRSSRWKRVLAVCWLVQTQSRADRIPPYLQMLSLLFWFIFKWGQHFSKCWLNGIIFPAPCVWNHSLPHTYAHARTHTHMVLRVHVIKYLSADVMCVCVVTQRTFSIMRVRVCVCLCVCV